MTILRLNLLGSFQTLVGEKPLTNFRSDKLRALLIYLMVEADRPHRRESLSGLLWPEFTQEAASRNLRKNLFLLRQMLDEVSPGFSNELLSITRQTVLVNPEHKIVDLDLFQEKLDSIKKHTHQHVHTCEPCLDQLIQAANLYEGEFVAGFSLADSPNFDSWLLIRRETLVQEIMVVLDNLTASFELKGDFQQAKFFARRQLALEPWQEKAHRQLMRVLVLEGRRGEALSQYDTCREVLWEELGVKPEPKTQLLFQKIKNGLLVSKENESRTQLHDFPTQFTTFIGREPILNQIVEQLTGPDCRLLTLIGQGGVGKTRLTVEAAHKLAEKGHFPGGIYFVPLTDIDEMEHFLLTLAGQLKISIFGRSHIHQHLLNYLAEQELLLVLDNFEQLIDAGDLLGELLQAAPKLKLLVSSREALNIRSEQRLLISGLSEKSAVSLFQSIARKNWPDYKPDEHDQPVIENICQLVGCIPLAVEIAAGWVKMMDLETIAGQIKSNVDFLQNQWQDAPERHQSMRVIFEQSWTLLSQGEQKALAQFSIFRGGFSLNAALAITKATINEIASLLDKSLLEHQGKSRYKLHELLRQFARVKLEEISSEEGIQALQLAYTHYYMNLVKRNETLLFGQAPQYGMEAIESEFENILQGWEWAVADDQVDLMATGLEGLRMYYELSGRFAEGTAFFESSIVPVSTGDGAKLYCRLLIATADFSNQVGDFKQGFENLQIALDMTAKHNWPDLQANANRIMGDYLNLQGKYDEAIPYLNKAITYEGKTKADEIDLVKSYYKLGIVYWRAQRWEDTRRTLIMGLNLAQQIGFIWAVDLTLMALGVVYRTLGEYDTALEHFNRGIELAQKISYIPGLSRGYTNAGLIHEDKGNYEKALEYYQNALNYDMKGGDKLSLSISNGNTARILGKLGRIEEALALINETIGLTRSLGFKIHIAWQLIVKAEILFSLGRFQEAEQVNEEGKILAIETTLSQRILQSQDLSVRIDMALGKQNAARLRLNKMLEDDPDIFTLATAHYLLWKLTEERPYGKQALAYYQQAFSEEPFIDYKLRIEELTKDFS